MADGRRGASWQVVTSGACPTEADTVTDPPHECWALFADGCPAWPVLLADRSAPVALAEPLFGFSRHSPLATEQRRPGALPGCHAHRPAEIMTPPLARPTCEAL